MKITADMKYVYIQNTVENCYLSYSTFEKIQVFLLMNGYVFVNNPDEANFAIINTCGGNKDTQEIMSKTIDKLNKNKVYTLFFGCFELIVKYKEGIKFPYDLLYSNRGSVVDDIFEHNISYDEIDSINIDMYKKYLVNGNFVKRYFIEILRGCVHNCTYCPIKKSIGYVKSKKIASIVEEFQYAVDNDYNEIVLLGEDAGSYGLDIGTNIVNLLSELTNIKGSYKINIHQFEPSLMIKYFDEIKKYLPYISKIILSAQSFNDRILKLMGRKYTVKELIDVIKQIKEVNKDIILENHIIYGYPTETFEEFRNNLYNTSYYKENIFNLYSDYEGLKKFTDDEKLTKEELDKRTAILIELEQKHSNVSLSWNGTIYPWQHKGPLIKCNLK